MWKTTMLDPVYGIVNWVLSPFGLGRNRLGEPVPADLVMINLVWQWTPFMMLLILAGLTSMPRDQLEAGRVDGATAFQLFRELTLPHLRRFIELGTVLGAIYLVNTFDAIYMMTQGGPGIASANLPFYIYQRAFLGFDIGQAAAMGVVVVIFTMIIATLRAPVDLQIVLRQGRGGLMTTTAEAHATTRRARSRSERSSTASSSAWGVVAWIVGLGFFFPVFWMVLTSFKQEVDAYTTLTEVLLHPDAGSVQGRLRPGRRNRRC